MAPNMLKTKSGLIKRVRLTANQQLRHGVVGSRHRLRNKITKRGQPTLVTLQDVKRCLRLVPYFFKK